LCAGLGVKFPPNYSVSYFNWGMGTSFGGISSPKPPHGDGTVKGYG